MSGSGFGIFLSASFTVLDLTFAELLDECDDSHDAIVGPARTLTTEKWILETSVAQCNQTDEWKSKEIAERWD